MTVPVELVDTGNASFAAGIAVACAAEVLADGGDVAAARAACGQVSERVASVFTVAEIDRARRGGRIVVDRGDGVPVVSMQGSDLAEIGRVHSTAPP